MQKKRISKRLKQGALVGAAIFLVAQIYAFRELVLLGIFFSIAFWLVAGVVCVGLLIFGGVHATLVWMGRHTSLEKFSLEHPIAWAQTLRIAGVRRIVVHSGPTQVQTKIVRHGPRISFESPKI
ncbi:MAG: hypothetical protein WA517_03635 [Candidatus Acidiferrum sp.]